MIKIHISACENYAIAITSKCTLSVLFVYKHLSTKELTKNQRYYLIIDYMYMTVK